MLKKARKIKKNKKKKNKMTMIKRVSKEREKERNYFEIVKNLLDLLFTFLPAKIAVAKLKFVSEQIKYFRKILENVKLESKLQKQNLRGSN